jgi:small-conductance mechanosensitive channel
MDEKMPFGIAYGPSNDRDEVIHSAHHVYHKLAQFHEENHHHSKVSSLSRVVNFDVIALIAYEPKSGKVIPAKLNAVKQLFRPDVHNELPLHAFVQSCDNIYKRLRYFRASVSNSSAIDKVLENMMDGIYWFVMIFLLLELLDFDPWTLLVSITSLLVSVSFAMGSSVSNYLEVRTSFAYFFSNSIV